MNPLTHLLSPPLSLPSTKMVSLQVIQTASRSIDQASSSPRVSFSAEFLDESNFISISPSPVSEKQILRDPIPTPKSMRNADFEFLSSNTSSHTMLTADELFFDGKLLPFWQMQQQEKLNNISLKTKEAFGQDEGRANNNNREKDEEEEPKMSSWFADDDPSPRPPKCTVLWKELLRLRKQRANSSLSPSSSTSSSSSSLAEAATKEDDKERTSKAEKLQVKRIKKGLERTRSASIRIRPMVNVPIYTQVKTSSSLPPLFPLKKVRLEKAKG